MLYLRKLIAVAILVRGNKSIMQLKIIEPEHIGSDETRVSANMCMPPCIVILLLRNQVLLIIVVMAIFFCFFVMMEEERAPHIRRVIESVIGELLDDRN